MEIFPFLCSASQPSWAQQQHMLQFYFHPRSELGSCNHAASINWLLLFFLLHTQLGNGVWCCKTQSEWNFMLHLCSGSLNLSPRHQHNCAIFFLLCLATLFFRASACTFFLPLCSRFLRKAFFARELWVNALLFTVFFCRIIKNRETDENEFFFVFSLFIFQFDFLCSFINAFECRWLKERVLHSLADALPVRISLCVKFPFQLSFFFCLQRKFHIEALEMHRNVQRETADMCRFIHVRTKSEMCKFLLSLCAFGSTMCRRRRNIRKFLFRNKRTRETFPTLLALLMRCRFADDCCKRLH